MSSTISLTSSYPFSLDDLNAAEARLWQRFPADFRTFYTQQNGGIVAPSAPRVFKFDDERNFPDGRVFHVHAATRAQITSALRAALTPKEPSHDFRTVLLDRAVAAEKAAKVALATEREKREAAETRIEQFQLGSQGRQGWSAWAWGGQR